MRELLLRIDLARLIRLAYRHLRHWHDHLVLVRRIHTAMLAVRLEEARSQWLKEQDDRTRPLRNNP